MTVVDVSFNRQVGRSTIDSDNGNIEVCAKHGAAGHIRVGSMPFCTSQIEAIVNPTVVLAAVIVSREMAGA